MTGLHMAHEIELVPGTWVGGDHPTFFLAEGGINHNGSLQAAKDLVSKAKQVGANAIKFQKRTMSAILTQSALDAPYASAHAYGPTYGQHRAALELSEADWRQLKAHADMVGIPLTGSGWDEASVDFLDSLGVPFFKVASADLSNFPLLAHTAAKGKPVVVSTGMADIDTVSRAVQFLQQHTQDIVLLHCTSAYPAAPELCNLRVIQTYSRRFPECVIGYSGHEPGVAVAAAAAVLGAKVVEKHFTLDRTLKGSDHAASLEPPGFTELVNHIREVEQALGDGIKRMMPGEEAAKHKLAKSLVAKVDIEQGSILQQEMLSVKGPGIGIAPCDIQLVVGKRAAVSIAADSIISLCQLSDCCEHKQQQQQQQQRQVSNSRKMQCYKALLLGGRG